MKILTIADVPSKALWDYYDESRLRGVDLILSCGDLPSAYLSFLVTFASCPLLYVHGNHDGSYAETPPEGCICVEDQIYDYEGLRILGLGGSMEYTGGAHQYTEVQMARRARRQRFALWRKKGFDLLLTHAPAKGVGDGSDLPHQGFSTFNQLMEQYRPAYMIHGHMHMNYGSDIPRICHYHETTVINAYERYLLEL